MLRLSDQTGHEVILEKKPGRIISLVPSQTELLYSLGLDEEVIGITRFCIHPQEWFRNKKRVGGTKDFKTDLIRSLQPDLILANKEENTKDKLEELQKDFPVWTSDIHTLPEAFGMIESVGMLTGKEEKANDLIQKCNAAFENLVPAKNRERILYFIWNKPWMCAGQDTFIHDMLIRCGFENACSGNRYPEISKEEIEAIAPDRILLSSEPFPFKEKHLAEISLQFPATRVQLVDGEYFSWYGSRMLEAPVYFCSVIAQPG
jgi:ABC-type Fe3+-hydroxamate transport system substrate-binding protein